MPRDSGRRDLLVTDQQWLEFLAVRGLASFVSEEDLLPLFFEDRHVAAGEPVYERGGLLHARRIALEIADELSRSNTPADGGRT
jgi:hypothetical protein